MLTVFRARVNFCCTKRLFDKYYRTFQFRLLLLLQTIKIRKLQSLPKGLEHHTPLQLNCNICIEKVLLVKELLIVASSPSPKKHSWVVWTRHCCTVKRMSCKRYDRYTTMYGGEGKECKEICEKSAQSSNYFGIDCSPIHCKQIRTNSV